MHRPTMNTVVPTFRGRHTRLELEGCETCAPSQRRSRSVGQRVAASRSEANTGRKSSENMRV